MDSIRPGLHGRSRFTAIPTPTPDSTAQERRWDVEEAAFVLFGGAPWRSFYENGAWHIASVRQPHVTWFVAAFGDVDVAIFRAVNATGVDSFEGIAFERMK